MTFLKEAVLVSGTRYQDDPTELPVSGQSENPADVHINVGKTYLIRFSR
jgi:hypothetical protein